MKRGVKWRKAYILLGVWLLVMIVLLYFFTELYA